MSLYKVTTFAGWVFYAVAINETAASELVGEMLNRKTLSDYGYGFEHERRVVKIELLAKTYKDATVSRDYPPQLIMAQGASCQSKQPTLAGLCSLAGRD